MSTVFLIFSLARLLLWFHLLKRGLSTTTAMSHTLPGWRKLIFTVDKGFCSSHLEIFGKRRRRRKRKRKNFGEDIVVAVEEILKKAKIEKA